MSGSMKHCGANLVVLAKHGLGVEASSRCVELLAKFRAEVFIQCGGRNAHGLNLLGLAALGARRGAMVSAVAIGEEAEDALAALRTFFATRFSRRQYGGECGLPPDCEPDGDAAPEQDLVTERDAAVQAAGNIIAFPRLLEDRQFPDRAEAHFALKQALE